MVNIRIKSFREKAVLFGVVLAMMASLSCGTKSGPTVILDLSGSSDQALNDGNVVDVVFAVTNVAVNDQILDQDGDNQPDFFAFPSDCGGGFPAGCGYPVNQSGTIKIGKLPLGFRYEVEIRFRDSQGAILYSGTNEFDNSGRDVQLGISVAAAE